MTRAKGKTQAKTSTKSTTEPLTILQKANASVDNTDDKQEGLKRGSQTLLQRAVAKEN